MKHKKEVIIKTASIKDAEEILELQKLAYVSEAEIGSACHKCPVWVRRHKNGKR